jgi:hypothetical protein
MIAVDNLLEPQNLGNIKKKLQTVLEVKEVGALGATNKFFFVNTKPIFF